MIFDGKSLFYGRCGRSNRGGHRPKHRYTFAEDIQQYSVAESRPCSSLANSTQQFKSVDSYGSRQESAKKMANAMKVECPLYEIGQLKSKDCNRKAIVKIG